MNLRRTQTGQTSENSGLTAPPNAPGQAESRASKERLDALIAARYEQPDDEADSTEPYPWEELYYRLMAEVAKGDNGKTRPRWDWRRALYIAWRCVPPLLRVPRYEHELATQLLGLTNTRTIRGWREKDPEIDKRIAALPKELLINHLSAVMAALVAVASDPDPKAYQDRKLFLEMTGQYVGKFEASVDLAVDHTVRQALDKVYGDDN
jgi:hypothetical protein